MDHEDHIYGVVKLKNKSLHDPVGFEDALKLDEVTDRLVVICNVAARLHMLVESLSTASWELHKRKIVAHPQSQTTVHSSIQSDVILHVRIVNGAPNQTFGVKDEVLRVTRSLVLRSITNQTLRAIWVE